jgi:glutamate-5-semialdehyde dehydrogenase
MNSAMNTIIEQFRKVQDASRELINLSVERINLVLTALAEETIEQTPYILSENQKDLDLMDSADPKYDRLTLTKERIAAIAADIRNVASLEYPVGRELEKKTMPNGLQITKVSVPLGVVGIIYEARPNVTFDVFSLCFKSGNACVLKGGSDAEHSNRAISLVIAGVLKKHGINSNMLYLMPSDRESTEIMLHAEGFIDLIIPRGSKGLIDHVRQNSTLPVIETGAGIVHTYFDENADLIKGTSIIDNAKTRRVSVCNALDCLIIHRGRLADLPAITKPLSIKNVILFADKEAYESLKSYYPQNLLHIATEEHFGTEFLSLQMAIKTVGSIDEALAHIAKFSSKHSEAIISENRENIQNFLHNVDAAAVYANTSTAFTDGAQFGLGAEIGISTQKLHARGPMGLRELTSYKWIVEGDGQVRNP